MPTSWTTHPQAPPTKITNNLISKHTNTPTNEAIEGQQDGVQDEKGEGEAEERRKQTDMQRIFIKGQKTKPNKTKPSTGLEEREKNEAEGVLIFNGPTRNPFDGPGQPINI
ncbi:hypothetical protein Tco_1150282 [Tanacetum coccineum]